MRIEMLCTGEEVLSGQIVDSNGAWVGQRLLEAGLELHSRLTVGDRLADLTAAFERSAGVADLVLINGGLGPTEDDLSSTAMASVMGVELQLNSTWLACIEQWFANSGREMTPNNRKQAYLPDGAVMIDNPVGTACGFRVSWQGTWFVFTPGPPHELKTMFNEQILPWLQKHYAIAAPVELYRLLTTGSGESALAQKLNSVELPPELELGYRASMPYIEIKLLRRGAITEARWQQVLQQIRVQLGENWVGDNVVSVAERCHQLLLAQEKTLTLAESCTGGLVASELVAFPGSSAYLLGSWVTYSNQAKQQELAVTAASLSTYGAVSLPVVIEMACGARTKLQSDFGVSISGIAGPDGGTENKPVGMVCLALAFDGGYVAQTLQFNGQRLGRNGVRAFAATIALDMLRRQLLGESPLAQYDYLTRVESCQG